MEYKTSMEVVIITIMIYADVKELDKDKLEENIKRDFFDNTGFEVNGLSIEKE